MFGKKTVTAIRKETKKTGKKERIWWYLWVNQLNLNKKLGGRGLKSNCLWQEKIIVQLGMRKNTQQKAKRGGR